MTTTTAPDEEEEAIDPVEVLDVELSRPSAPPGGGLVIDGTGCPPNSTVNVFIDGESALTTRADENGNFSVGTDLPELEIGRHDVVVECAGVRAEETVDVVSSAANGGESQLGLVLAFFTALGVAVLHQRRDPASVASR